ncbi:MAG: ATP-binding protein [Desulfarculaceae bacterium]|jgi:two-component system NtrC family sensor kinase
MFRGKFGTGKQGERRYRVLTGNLVLFVIVTTMAPLLITGVIILFQFRDAYQVKVLEHLQELVQKHSQNIETFLTNRLGDIRVLARASSLEELKDSNFLRRRLEILREEYGGAFVDLGLVDAQGKQVAYAGPFNLTLADYSGAKWFERTLAGEHFISDVFTGLRGTPHFIVAVKKGCEKTCFILRATIDFEHFNALVENIRVGETGFAFILNREGKFQTKPPYEVAVQREPYAKLLTKPSETGSIPVMVRTDSLGRKFIYAAAPLEKGHWLLCLQQQADDAFANLNRTVNIGWLLFAAIGAAAVVVGFLVSRHMVGQIAQADRARAVMSDKVIEAGRLASIGELAAGIAHEINNPVAIMVEEAGWIQDLLEDQRPPGDENLAEIERAVKQIRTQGGRCKEITHKLLSFARKTDPTEREINLNELVSEVMSLLTQKTRYANVEIKADLAAGLPPISASPSEMQQVLLNLLNNAVDAMGPEGGVITVGTSRGNEGQIEITVADTGIGIAEANLPRVFDPFYTTKPVGQGTGLGLSIVYGIIKKLGGDISVRSRKGEGTVFKVFLPVQSQGIPTSDGSGANSPGNPAGGKADQEEEAR